MRSGGQEVRRSGGQEVRRSGGQEVRRSGGQEVRGSGGLEVMDFRRSGGRVENKCDIFSSLKKPSCVAQRAQTLKQL